jgi:DNA-binding CsgD family transcriptional regulator
MNGLNLEIIERIYDVPLGRSTWLDVLDDLKVELEAKMALLFLARNNHPPILITTTIPDEKVWSQYIEYFNTIDPWNEALLSGKFPKNYIHFGRAFISEKTFKSSEYYADFWSQLGLGETIGGSLVTQNGITIQLGIPRHHDQSHYDVENTFILRQYCQHIVRAVELEGFMGNSLPSGIYENGLISQYGLSSAEAKLLLEIFKTENINQVASNLNRSYHTVRTQLRSILKKTETRSQLELFKKILRPS